MAEHQIADLDGYVRYLRGNRTEAIPSLLDRSFVPDEAGGYRIGKAIREMVVFALQNIISDPTFTKLSICDGVPPMSRSCPICSCPR